MRFSTFPLVITALVAAGLSSATRKHATANCSAKKLIAQIPLALNTRADQTIILPLSGDPFGSPFEFQFADEVSLPVSLSSSSRC